MLRSNPPFSLDPRALLFARVNGSKKTPRRARCDLRKITQTIILGYTISNCYKALPFFTSTGNSANNY